MLRLWIHSQASATSATPSVLLSVAAHAALVGAVVAGHGDRSLEREEEAARRVYYLPPPDRRPSTESLAEQIRYVEVGNGARLDDRAERRDGAAGPAPAADPGTSGASGADPLDQASRSPSISSDSVYSVLELAENAARMDSSVAPSYPPELIEKRVEGMVLTHFVVDTMGRADSMTIEVLQATHPLFVESVRLAIPGMRFTPATVDGRRVRQVVEQRFQFRITPPVSAPAEHTRAVRAP